MNLDNFLDTIKIYQAKKSCKLNIEFEIERGLTLLVWWHRCRCF